MKWRRRPHSPACSERQLRRAGYGALAMRCCERPLARSSSCASRRGAQPPFGQEPGPRREDGWARPQAHVRGHVLRRSGGVGIGEDGRRIAAALEGVLAQVGEHVPDRVVDLSGIAEDREVVAVGEDATAAPRDMSSRCCCPSLERGVPGSPGGSLRPLRRAACGSRRHAAARVVSSRRTAASRPSSVSGNMGKRRPRIPAVMVCFQ